MMRGLGSWAPPPRQQLRMQGLEGGGGVIGVFRASQYLRAAREG